MGDRPYVSENPFETPQYIKYAEYISALMTARLPLRENTQNELKPRQLKLSPKAKNEWIGYHNSVDRDAGPGGRFESIRGTANKAAEQSARIAGVLTLILDANADQIELIELDAAITLSKYYMEEYLRIQDSGAVDPDLTLAEKTREWAMQYDYVYPVLMYQRGPNGVRTSADAKRIAEILDKHGHWIKIEGGMVLDDKMRRDAWKVER